MSNYHRCRILNDLQRQLEIHSTKEFEPSSKYLVCDREWGVWFNGHFLGVIKSYGKMYTITVVETIPGSFPYVVAYSGEISQDFMHALASFGPYAEFIEQEKVEVTQAIAEPPEESPEVTIWKGIKKFLKIG